MEVWYLRMKEEFPKNRTLFEFRALNRLADAETALDLVHLLYHLSSVAF